VEATRPRCMRVENETTEFGLETNLTLFSANFAASPTFLTRDFVPASLITHHHHRHRLHGAAAAAAAASSASLSQQPSLIIQRCVLRLVGLGLRIISNGPITTRSMSSTKPVRIPDSEYWSKSCNLGSADRYSVMREQINNLIERGGMGETDRPMVVSTPEVPPLTFPRPFSISYDIPGPATRDTNTKKSSALINSW